MSEPGATPVTCSEVVDLVSDYVDDALSAATRDRVEAHLRTCPDCTAYVAQLRTTIRVLGRLREEDIPRPVLDRLMHAFRGWHAG